MQKPTLIWVSMRINCSVWKVMGIWDSLLGNFPICSCLVMPWSECHCGSHRTVKPGHPGHDCFGSTPHVYLLINFHLITSYDLYVLSRMRTCVWTVMVAHHHWPDDCLNACTRDPDFQLFLWPCRLSPFISDPSHWHHVVVSSMEEREASLITCRTALPRLDVHVLASTLTTSVYHS